MNKITFEEYKNAIRAQYEVKKTDGIYGSGDLSNITPAQLRNLCLYISENCLTSTDESTFRLFFNAKGDEKLTRAIDNFGTGKLKSVISFLKGEKKSDNSTRIELASIIIDFNPRPFNKYRQNGGEKNIPAIQISPVEERNEFVSNDSDFGELITNKTIIKERYNIKSKLPFFGVFLFVIFAGFVLKNTIFPTKECMQWKENHYEAVDCSNDKLGIGQWDIIVPIDENIMKLEKLDSKKELVFFKNDKPMVWYFKEDGKIELFNQPGFHPEAGKPLKPITGYIIEKYKLKHKQ
jgi:hypothetical protein